MFSSGQRVFARRHELHLLRLAHDQLGAVFDFLVAFRKAVRQRVAELSVHSKISSSSPLMKLRMLMAGSRENLIYET